MTSTASFWSDASWFVHQLDVFEARVMLLRLSEENYRQSIFLDQRMAVREPAQQVVSIRELANEMPPASRPAQWLFHIGHCGSTLLSQTLQHMTPALPLREPTALLALAHFERQRDDPLSLLSEDQYQRLQRFILAALSRSFADDQLSIIKPTSACCNLAPAALNAHPASKALFIHLPAEPYLATMLRSELRRQEVTSQAQTRMADLHRIHNSELRIFDLDIGQLAAANWLATRLQMKVLARDYPERLLPVDFESLLARPDAELARVTQFLDISATPESTREAYRRATAGYSKDPGMHYSSEHRTAELNASRERFAHDIQSGLRWLEQNA